MTDGSERAAVDPQEKKPFKTGRFLSSFCPGCAIRGFIGVHFLTVYHFGKGMNKGEKLCVRKQVLYGRLHSRKQPNAARKIYVAEPTQCYTVLTRFMSWLPANR
jgi:hypothetical protein